MKPSVPSSDAFWILSSAYRDAGDSALALIRGEAYTGFIVVPCVFLYFRCIELALKSALIFHGVPDHEITRTLGHRVSLLLARAETFSSLDALGFSVEDRAVLDAFSDAYSDKWFEYPNDIPGAYPEPERLQTLAHRVCDAIRNYERAGPNCA